MSFTGFDAFVLLVEKRGHTQRRRPDVVFVFITISKSHEVCLALLCHCGSKRIRAHFLLSLALGR